MIGWGLVSLSLVAMACGTVLVALAHFHGRSELWNVGMPILIGGQLSFLMGMVLQMERLRSSNRQTDARLQRVDHALYQMHLAGPPVSAPPPYPYPPYAPPSHLSLAEMKRQLDELKLEVMS